jgi:iron(III) transport system ATP-binding protein
MPADVKAGEAVKIAVRPENVKLGANGAAPNQFTARVAAQRYQGTQTVYELAVLGVRLEALELGTSMRHAVGSDVEVVLPPALCWAYPASDTAGSELADSTSENHDIND